MSDTEEEKIVTEEEKEEVTDLSDRYVLFFWLGLLFVACFSHSLTYTYTQLFHLSQ